MNFCKGQNAFSDIPGFDASKGERVVKALQKLWGKIELLEQKRISEKKSRSEVTQASSSKSDEDLTITDIQYKLLVLQLQYARSILRKKLGKNDVAFHSTISEDDQNSPTLNKQYVKKNEHHKDCQDTAVTQDICAGRILTERNPHMKSDILKDVETIDAPLSTNDQSFLSEQYCEQPTSAAYKVPSSKPHYHLKLDDVPFILGASATASHSVVANVQNIIAMMKSHNKALCGPKHHVSRPVVNASPDVGDTGDATKMLNDLSKDLYELALKQQKLAKSIDAAQGKNQSSNTSKALRTDRKPTAGPRVRRYRSNSESEIKLHAEVKNFPKRKENDYAKYNVHQKQNVLNVRNQPSNLSIMDRRKLLRSLQTFKTHLSEEDISWD